MELFVSSFNVHTIELDSLRIVFTVLNFLSYFLLINMSKVGTKYNKNNYNNKILHYNYFG